MKVTGWILTIVIAAPAVLVAGIYTRNKIIGPVGWAEDNTMRELRMRMRDPDSMVIRSQFVVTKRNADGDQEIAICGVVDGRNAFGGYAGGSRFVSLSVHLARFDAFDTQLVEVEDPRETAEAREVGMLSGFESVYWNDHCVDSQHPPLTPS